MNDTLPPLPNWVFCDDLGGLVPSEIRSAMVAYAREALAAYEALAAHDAEQSAQAVPAGFKLVPVEFIEAGQRIAQDYARTNPKWPMWDNGEAEPKVQDPCGAHAWLERAAMLAAAPTPPAPDCED